jgi:hypothetical protein
MAKIRQIWSLWSKLSAVAWPRIDTVQTLAKIIYLSLYIICFYQLLLHLSRTAFSWTVKAFKLGSITTFSKRYQITKRRFVKSKMAFDYSKFSLFCQGGAVWRNGLHDCPRNCWSWVHIPTGRRGKYIVNIINRGFKFIFHCCYAYRQRILLIIPF